MPVLGNLSYEPKLKLVQSDYKFTKKSRNSQILSKRNILQLQGSKLHHLSVKPTKLLHFSCTAPPVNHVTDGTEI